MGKKELIDDLKSKRDILAARAKKRLEDPLSQFKSMSGKELLNYKDELVPFETDTIFDNITELYDNSLVTIVGSTGMGKSLLLLHTAVRMSKIHKVLYFSHENDTPTDHDRIKRCIESYLPGQYNLDNIEYINVFESKIEEETKLNWDERLIELKISSGDYDVVMFDSIQIEYDDCEQDEIHRLGSVVFNNLKRLAYEFRVPIFVSWQGSRESNGKDISKIQLNDITGSYSMATLASDLIFIGKCQEKHNDRCIRVLKRRNTKDRDKEELVDLELTTRFSVEKFKIL